MPAGTDSIIKKLEEQERKEGKLPQVLEFYRELVKIQSRVGKRIGVPNPGLTGGDISARAEQGRPLIEFEDLALDWSLLSKTFGEIAVTFAKYPELFGLASGQLAGAADKQSVTEEAIKAWFEGATLPSDIAATQFNEALLKDIIHASLKPFLFKYSTALLHLVKQEGWRRGYCPICGGNADFGFLDAELGSRWLVCSRCDAEWLFQRLQCPFCGTTDQNALSYFSDDEGLYRLYVCEQCKHYLKTIDLRRARSEVLIPLERLFTLNMDKQARENGYSPCE